MGPETGRIRETVFGAEEKRPVVTGPVDRKLFVRTVADRKRRAALANRFRPGRNVRENDHAGDFRPGREFLETF